VIWFLTLPVVYYCAIPVRYSFRIEKITDISDFFRLPWFGDIAPADSLVPIFGAPRIARPLGTEPRVNPRH
jgi:hypothetical protein